MAVPTPLYVLQAETSTERASASAQMAERSLYPAPQSAPHSLHGVKLSCRPLISTCFRVLR